MSLFINYLVMEGELAPLDSLEGRGRRRAEVEKLFLRVARAHPPCLRTPIDFSSGEVFQALVRHPEQLPPLLADLLAGLHDEDLHLGLGWGPLSTPLSGRVRRMDGPAFDRARIARRQAIERGIWASASGFGEDTDQIVEGHLLLWGQVQASWKPKQRETVAWMRRLGRRKEVAEVRGVGASTVTRSLDGAFYEGVRALEHSLSLVLGAVDENRSLPATPPEDR